MKVTLERNVNRWGEYSRSLKHHVMMFRQLLIILLLSIFYFSIFEIVSFISIKAFQNTMGFTIVFSPHVTNILCSYSTPLTPLLLACIVAIVFWFLVSDLCLHMACFIQVARDHEQSLAEADTQ